MSERLPCVVAGRYQPVEAIPEWLKQLGALVAIKDYGVQWLVGTSGSYSKEISTNGAGKPSWY
jgi:hypothetical protein